MAESEPLAAAVAGRGRESLYRRLRSLALLTALLAVILASGLSQESGALWEVASNLFYLVVFCVAGYLIGARKRWLLAYAGLAVPALIFGVMLVFFPENTTFAVLKSSLTLGLQLALVWLVFRFSLFEGGIKELDRVIAGICGYLILGLLFANLYGIYNIVSPGNFTDSSGAELNGFDGSFVYFSLVTLTTLGYGDISPTARFPRLLASLEAVAGALYLAVFISSLIAGRHGRRD